MESWDYEVMNSGIGLSSGDMDNGSPASTNSEETLLSSVPSTLDDCLERYTCVMLYHMCMRNKDVCTVMLVLHVCTNLGFHFVGSLVPRTLALSIRSSAANAIATRSVVYNMHIL